MISLDEFFSRYPHMKVAGPSDNPGILRFFDETAMKGTGTILRYERSPDFFHFLDFSSSRHFVLCLELDDDIKVVGTVVLRPGMVKGEQHTVGYLGDLRVKADRKAAVLWRRFYSDLLEAFSTIEEFEGCRHLLTAIIDENLPAINALVKNERFPYLYLPKASYEMVNISGRTPMALISRFRSYEVRTATEDDRDQVMTFLARNHHQKDFGFCFNQNHNELDYRLKNWPGLKWQDMILVFRGESVVGFAMLWGPSPVKRIVVERVPTLQEMGLRMLSPFYNTPVVGEELKIQYLNLLTLDSGLERMEKKKAFREMLNFIYDSGMHVNHHFISYCEFPVLEPLRPPSSHYITFQTPMTLFQVMNKLHQGEVEIKGESAPDFEMSLV